MKLCGSKEPWVHWSSVLDLNAGVTRVRYGPACILPVCSLLPSLLRSRCFLSGCEFVLLSVWIRDRCWSHETHIFFAPREEQGRSILCPTMIAGTALETFEGFAPGKIVCVSINLIFEKNLEIS